MNCRTVVLKVFCIALSGFVTAEDPPPPLAEVDEVLNGCFVDSGPMDCGALNSTACRQEFGCPGTQFSFSANTGNEVTPTDTGGHLGDFVYQEECYKYADCIVISVVGQVICGPDLFNIKTHHIIAGHVNWDFECPQW